MLVGLLEVDAKFHGVSAAEAVEYAEGIFPCAGFGRRGVCVDYVVVVEEIVHVAGESGFEAADFEGIGGVEVKLLSPGNTPWIGHLDGAVGSIGR